MIGKKVAIIGGGPWGDALASAFARESKEVMQFSRKRDKKPIIDSIDIRTEYVDLYDREYILVVVPAQKVRECFDNIHKHLRKNCVVVICSKGIEINTGKLLSEVACEYFPKENIAVLSGPNFAKEIVDEKPAMSSLAAYSVDKAKLVAKDLETKILDLYPTEEIEAVQIFGALKNVLAILCGFAKGLSFGENEMSALIVKGIGEIGKMASERGNRPPSMVSPGCIGDVILTCTSKTSRNTSYGMHLANKTLEKQEDNGIKQTNIEGVNTIMALSNIDLSCYPLLNFSVELLNSKSSQIGSFTKKFRDILFG